MRRELKYFRFWLTLGWATVFGVVYFSLTSLPPIELPFDSGDKVGHFFAYLTLMGWFVQLFANRWMLIAHALFLIGLGVGLEFAQELHGRHFEVADMVANSLGVLFGFLLLFTPLHRLLQRFEGRFFVHN